MEESQTVNNPQEVNQPIQTPIENPVPTKLEVKPKKNSGLAVILSFTTIIATLIAGFFYFQNIQLRDELAKKIEIASTPIPTATPNEIEDLITYKNDDYNFSFKYPKEANLVEDDCVSLQIVGPTQTEATEAFDGLYLNFCPETLVDQTIDEWIETDISGDIEVIKAKSEFSLKTYIAYTYETLGLMQQKNIAIQSPDSESIIVVITDITQDPTNQGYKEIVDEIISTFEYFN
ncbi:hypothetical protein KJ570_03305 [Patescibacteria group bacterium]|nr:hypothetical protein [Patescibacteria group bacterium]MBU2036129.1 hypothetical protein [Patescibacteria group bacterium]